MQPQSIAPSGVTADGESQLKIGALNSTGVPTFQQMKSIIERVKSGNIQAVQNEIQRFGVDAKKIYYDTYKQTPIFYCSLIKDRTLCVQMLNFFKDQGVDLAYKDTLRQTALYYASREGINEMITCLVQAGCKLNDKDEYGQTPLYYACREGKTDTVRLLLSTGADCNSVDMHGQTAIFYAAKNGRVDISQILIDAGANFQMEDNKGITPVVAAHRSKKS